MSLSANLLIKQIRGKRSDSFFGTRSLDIEKVFHMRHFIS